MKIVALYIEEHDYLFDSQPLTINFGGRYFYSFKKIDKNNMEIQRNSNKHFINHFYKSTNAEASIELISAIVGENGVGKSSVLDEIIIRLRAMHQEHRKAKTIILVEDNDNTKALYSFCELYITENYAKVYIEQLEKNVASDYQTIYYSPALDLKYDFGFETDKYDISLDNIIETDLEDLDKKGTTEHGTNYSAIYELVFKNSRRQISLLASDIVKNNNVFNELFQLPKYNKGTIYIRNYNNDKSPWNTPSQFRPVIQLIKEKLQIETKDWNKKKLSRKEVQKLFIRNNILESFISVIEYQMEKRNTYLAEGIFVEPYNLERFNNKTAKEVFFDFVKGAHVANNGNKKVFNHDNIENLYNRLDQTLSKDENIRDQNNKSFDASLGDIEEILNYDRKFLTDLFLYYPPTYDEGLVDRGSYIDGFISFMPTDKKLSSGETALLNFFSRLYDLIHSNLTGEAKSRPNKKHYILLLDEADLGFHPQWKKRFIKSLINSLPHFFDELEQKPTLQIIFTTHDPLTLSDLPNSNVVYMVKNGNESKVLDRTTKERPTRTFGANISDLLADSFFINNGLIGDFAKEKIEKTINWINGNKDEKKRQADFVEELAYHKKLIEIIDERILKLKLSEMISELEPNNNFAKEMIDSEIAILTEQRNRLP